MTEENAADKSGQMAYLDLLTSVLTQHEQTLDSIIRRLGRGLDELQATAKALLQVQEQSKTSQSTTAQRGTGETITYMKIDINRPVEDVTKILESLTDKPTGISTIVRVPPLKSRKKTDEGET